MPSSRTVECNICGKELEVRSNFAYQTLYRHQKEHK